MLTVLIAVAVSAAVTRWWVRRRVVAQVSRLQTNRDLAEIAKTKAESDLEKAQSDLSDVRVAVVHAQDQYSGALAHITAMHSSLSQLAERLDQGAHIMAARQIRAELAAHSEALGVRR